MIARDDGPDRYDLNRDDLNHDLNRDDLNETRPR
jgi:hypothetical protein